MFKSQTVSDFGCPSQWPDSTFLNMPLNTYFNDFIFFIKHVFNISQHPSKPLPTPVHTPKLPLNISFNDFLFCLGAGVIDYHEFVRGVMDGKLPATKPEAAKPRKLTAEEEQKRVEEKKKVQCFMHTSLSSHLISSHLISSHLFVCFYDMQMFLSGLQESRGVTMETLLRDKLNQRMAGGTHALMRTFKHFDTEKNGVITR